MKTSLLIADHVDTLASGKLAALGLYTDSVIVAQLAATDAEPTADLPMGFFLSLVLTVHAAPAEEVQGSLRVTGPDGYASPEALLPPLKFPPGVAANLVVRLTPLLVHRSGLFKVLVRYGDEINEHTFEVRIKRQPAAPSAAVSPTAALPARKDAPRRPRRATSRPAT